MAIVGQPVFWIWGEPQTQGSMRAFVRGQRAVITSANKNLKSWRNSVADAARMAGWGDELIDGPVHLNVGFIFARPMSHYDKKGNCKPSAPEHPHLQRADLDKLIRAIGDALTGVVWTDDRRIVGIAATKMYGGASGCRIEIRILPDGE